jgi:hypothetical protein
MVPEEKPPCRNDDPESENADPSLFSRANEEIELLDRQKERAEKHENEAKPMRSHSFHTGL